MKLSKTKFLVLAGILAVSSSAFAGGKHKNNGKHSKHKQFVYGKVIRVTPVYREVRVSNPVRECWSEPVRYTTTKHHVNNSAGSTLAGALIGGVIGNQIGKGRGKKLATAAGTIIGAQVGHDSSKGHYEKPSRDSYTRYEERCETQNHVSYEEVVDSYKVSYRYKGTRYQTNMPYDPGNRIKLKITVEPVF